MSELVTQADLDFLWSLHDGRCPLCSRALERRPRGYAIDHDHRTGRIRGLICSRCNRSLGMLGDSVESIERVLRYVKGEHREEMERAAGRTIEVCARLRSACHQNKIQRYRERYAADAALRAARAVRNRARREKDADTARAQGREHSRRYRERNAAVLRERARERYRDDAEHRARLQATNAKYRAKIKEAAP